MTPCLNFRSQPNLTSLRTILADIDLRSPFEELGSEVVVGSAFPNLVEVFLLNVAKSVGNVFVEAARGYQAIPGDDAAVPEFPAVVLHFVFLAISAVLFFVVAGVLLVGRHQWVAVFVVVELGGFEFHFVDPDFVGEADDILHLVFVGLDDQELENEVGCWAVEFLLPLHQVPGALEHRFQLTGFTVLLVDLLRCAINGDDEAVETAFDGPFGVGVVEEVAVGGGNGIDAPIGGILDHIQKIGIDVWLALEIEDEVQQLIGNVVHRSGKEVGFQVSCRPGKLAQAAGTLGTPEVTGGGWLKGHRKGLAPHHRALQPTRGVVAGRYFHCVDDAARGQFAEEVEGVFGV